MGIKFSQKFYKIGALKIVADIDIKEKQSV